MKLSMCMVILITFLFSLLFPGCDTLFPGGIGWETTPPPTIFTKPADPEKIVSVKEDNETLYSFPVDQILVKMDNASTESDARSLARSLSGSIVGQIPDVGIYQLEVSTSSKTELDSRITQAQQYEGVTYAAYNLIPDFQDVGSSAEYCRHDDDNEQLDLTTQKCPHLDIHYSSIVPIMGKVKENMNLSTVRVGIIDSGFNVHVGQFDDIKYFNMNDPFSTPVDTRGHGTEVASIIAADNGDGVINGIASRVLGSKLELVVGGQPSTTTSEILMFMFMASHFAGADIVNMSLSYGEIFDAYDINLIQGMYKPVIEQCPNTLFVVAASNKPFTLTRKNDCPAGMLLPNLITVGGTSFCDPDQPWYESATSGSAQGPLIDIAAPAQHVPVANPFLPGQIKQSTGNSFAAPQVTALAAILKSISPSLKPDEIKGYIMDFCYPASSKVGSRRLILPLPIEQLLIEINAPQEVLDVIDADENPGQWDVPGIVEHRICGGTIIDVSNEGTFTFPPDNDTVSGFLNAMGFGITASDEIVTFTLHIYEEHKIINEYSISSMYGDPNAPGVAHITFSRMVDDIVHGGSSAGGKVTFSKCTVTERDGIMDWPLSVELEGTLDGSITWMAPPDPAVGGRTVTAMFKIPVVIMPTDDIVTYLEETCEGGRNNTE